MSYNASAEMRVAIIWATATTLMVFSVVFLLVALSVRVSNNDHAKILRDQQVRVVCIQSGGQLVKGDSCVPAVR